MVGTETASVIFGMNASSTHSTTIANAPAAATA